LTNNFKIAAVVLAAGASTRMGEPKQLLPWKSTTLLNHCLNEVVQAKVHQTFVVLGAYHQKIQATINQTDIQCIVNKNWKTGMGSSIALAAQALKNKDIDGLLIVLADQPFVKTNYLDILLKEFRPKNKQIIATDYTNTIGVPVIFDKHYFEELSLLKEKQGAKKLIHQYTQNVIKIIPDFKHQDIDTPEVYRQLYSL
jgi:molybdenum cofactor cytidylyltransferase